MNLNKNILLNLILILAITLWPNISLAQTDMELANYYLTEAMKATYPDTRYTYAQKALQHYKTKYESDNSNLPSMIGIGRSYALLENRYEAKNILMQADKMYPAEPKLQTEIANFYFYFQEYNTALEFYKLALSSGYLKDYITNFSTANCYQKLGDSENAVLYYKVCLYLKPNDEQTKNKLKKLLQTEKNKTTPTKESAANIS